MPLKPVKQRPSVISQQHIQGEDPVIDMKARQIREGETTEGRCSAQIHHAVQSQLGKHFLLVGNLNVIDHMALHEIFHGPT